MGYANNQADVVMFAAFFHGYGISYLSNIVAKCPPVKKSNEYTHPNKTLRASPPGYYGIAPILIGRLAVLDLVTRCVGLVLMLLGGIKHRKSR